MVSLGLGLSIPERSGVGNPAAVAPPAPLSETVALSTGAATSSKLTDSAGQKLKRWQGIVCSVTGLTWTGTVTGIFLRVSVDGTFDSGASDYVYCGMDDDGQVGASAAVSNSGMLLSSHTTTNAQLAFVVQNLGLAVPTAIEAWDMNVSTTASKTYSGIRAAAAINDGIQLVLVGSSPVITAGTMYLGYY